MRGNSIISQSGQIWKVIVGLALLIGGAAAGVSVSFVPYLRAVTISLGQFDNLQAVSTVAAAAGFVCLCLTIRCPNCSAKWIWMAVNGKLGTRSLDALATLDRCPTCGYPGQQSTGGTAL